MKLLPLNGKRLLELRNELALKTFLTDTSPVIFQLISLSIETLVKKSESASANDAVKYSFRRPCKQSVKSGDLASKDMLPIELRDEYYPRSVIGNGGFGVVIRAGSMVNGSTG